MKHVNLKIRMSVFLLIVCGIFSTLGLSAQTVTTISIKGVIKDYDGEPAMGATIKVQNTSIATVADFDGNFSLNVPSDGILEVSYVGAKTQTIPVKGKTSFSISLLRDSELLDDLVVIGYGSVKKNDLTGSVVAIKAEEINRGAVTSPQQLLQGKVSGLFVQPGNGAPGSGSTLRIRSGASLNASNDPLIVIDGIPTYGDAAPGTPNALATINPNDIESFSILKDASATAIYGSRASNGVIIITTKKGKKGALKINYSSTYSFNDPYKKLETMDANEFYRTISTYYPQGTTAGDNAYALLNKYKMQSTDWQDQIFQTGFAVDQNISVSGITAGNVLPFRISMGYNNEDGTLKTSNYERYTGSINLSPKFFKDLLSIDFNMKGTINNNQFADEGAVGSAAFYDPTKPVYDATGKNGYWNHITESGAPNRQASVNPLEMLNDVDNHGTTKRSLGNLQIDYKMHFLPELRANLNLGYDVATSTGYNGPKLGSFQAFRDTDFPNIGQHTEWNQLRRNQLMDFYLNYNKYFESIKSNVDVMGGYSYQHFYESNSDITASNVITDNGAKDGWTYNSATSQYEKDGQYLIPTEYFLISFFGRLNYNFLNRYLFTATLRNDGSSRFSKDNRWGLFPSAALAWTITNESFMKDVSALSNLKLRLGYGVTGQQGYVGSNYSYIPNYYISSNPNSTYLGHYLVKPGGYNPDLKWEQTATKNIAIDYGFLNNRINGSIEFYRKDTKDLLNEIDWPTGTNFINRFVSNIGEMNNKGVEFNINAVPVQTKDFTWDANFNITWNESEIGKLTASESTESVGINTGGLSYGTGLTAQKHLKGYAPSTFFLYQQVYDENGKPIQNVFVDRNNDGQISEADRYMTNKSPLPKVYMGFGSTFNYKKFDLGFNLRANLGNYVFNAFYADNSTPVSFSNQGFLSNLYRGVLETGFQYGNTTEQELSDYFLENASFLKMDNITAGYSFSKLFTEKLSGRLSFSVQNVFTVTKFSGLDPEISSGINTSAWPRSRAYTLGLNINF
ncbi:MAG: SusC/RagA family TonB-linked outer membrane protein [Dysgonomonas sp.]